MTYEAEARYLATWKDKDAPARCSKVIYAQLTTSDHETLKRVFSVTPVFNAANGGGFVRGKAVTRALELNPDAMAFFNIAPMD